MPSTIRRYTDSAGNQWVRENDLTVMGASNALKGAVGAIYCDAGEGFGYVGTANPDGTFIDDHIEPDLRRAA